MLKIVLLTVWIGVILGVVALLTQTRTAMAEETPLSEDFSMVMHPMQVGIEIDESDVQEISDFFHRAERAIQSENIDALMLLYSDKYTNLRSGDKQFAMDLWSRIFARFDNIASRHSMKLISYDKAAGQAITECNGLLFGTPKGESNLVLIDRWDDQQHILIKEDDWRLLGSAGTPAMRYGEEGVELHPLF